jgi:hypothetical protein
VGFGNTFIMSRCFDMENAKRDVAELRRELDYRDRTHLSQAQLIATIERENAELKLYLAALYRMLAAKGVITTEEIEAMVNAVDESDGAADGRYDGDIV